MEEGVAAEEGMEEEVVIFVLVLETSLVRVE